MVTISQRRAREKTRAKLGDQIKASLDGRTQRWLASKMPMADDYLSNKLNGRHPFTDAEINKINEILGTEFINVKP